MFDNVAEIYDKDFTFTEIGKLQRKEVWDYLNSVLFENKKLNILELNCGTGEDAVYFASKGHRVTATDISEKMVVVAKQKISDFDLNDLVDVLQCDMRNIKNCNLSEKYDIVFSNFGGLNCLNTIDLKKLSLDLKSLLVKNGRFIAVVMPKFCFSESLYFFTKFEWNKIFRRNTNKGIFVPVGDSHIETWYYSPEIIVNVFQQCFKKLATKPIGITLPPSYMESFFAKRKNLLNNLGNIERKINKVPGLSYAADHFLIDLVVK